MSTSAGPLDNRLLARLPAPARECLVANGEEVNLPFSEMLAEPDKPLCHAYFPTDSFVSLIAAVEGRPGLEVGLIGDEGMVGASLVLGAELSPTHALVQGAGPALRVEIAVLHRELEGSPALRSVLNRYVRVMLGQLVQTAVCTRFHRVEARLARWLLMTHDRAHSDSFHLTHEFMAYMLGVRRVGITGAASALQKRKLIRYRRGNVTILDRGGLEAAACGCYAADRELYSRIMDAA